MKSAKAIVQTSLLSLSIQFLLAAASQQSLARLPSAKPPIIPTAVSRRRVVRKYSFAGEAEARRRRGILRYGVAAPSLIPDSHCICQQSMREVDVPRTHQEQIPDEWRYVALSESSLDHRRSEHGICRTAASSAGCTSMIRGHAHPKHPPMINASIQVSEGNILVDG